MTWAPVRDYYVTKRQQQQPRRGNKRQTQRKMTGLPGGGLRIHHREFCGTLNHVTSTPAYNHPVTNTKQAAIPMTLPLNPGDGQTFPWLNGVATRFEKYKFHSLRFSYEPTCSTFENGGVAICPIYDPNDPVPSDRMTLMNAQGVKRGPVWEKLSLSIPSSAMRPNDTMYVREYHSELIDPAEQRTTDLGYVAIVLTDTNPIDDPIRNFGDVFVEYTVDLLSPRVGLAASKCAYIHAEDVTDVFAPVDSAHQPLLQTDTDFASREVISPNSTIMFDLEHSGGDGSDEEAVYKTESGTNVRYTALTFREPFTGLAYITVDVPDHLGTDPVTVMINGQAMDSETVTELQLQTGNQHPHRFARVKPLKAIKSGLTSVAHAVKVVAQAGESLAMSLNHQIPDGENKIVQLILTEAAEAIMDALPVLLA